MGREIRMVPRKWKHPIDEEGNYIPMHDQTFEDAAKEWKEGYAKWEKGVHEDQKKGHGKDLEYWEWDGPPPDRERYRPAFKSPADHFQIYQTVSEGTPVSPVFATKDNIIEWLVAKGYSEKAAETFAKDGFAPSATFSPKEGFRKDIHSLG